jgi:phospholipid/cholesterol/gamma-HCH transport system permease protein
MIPAMATSLTPTLPLSRVLARFWSGGWQIIHLGAMLLALLLSPSTYRRERRPLLATHLVRAAIPLTLWFSVVSALLSVVVIRIVLVTAQSYGLSQYAMEMVVRVLVLELIPLIAAMFVALRVTLPAATDLAALRQSGGLERLRAAGGDPLCDEVFPRALAGMFAVMLLAALSGVVCLVLAYLLAYGFSPWGLDRYTRLVGQVFNPAVTLIFALKTGAFALAVSVFPLGSALHDRPYAAADATPVSIELQGLVRMFLAVLVVEIVSLMGNYY